MMSLGPKTHIIPVHDTQSNKVCLLTLQQSVMETLFLLLGAIMAMLTLTCLHTPYHQCLPVERENLMNQIKFVEDIMHEWSAQLTQSVGGVPLMMYATAELLE